HRAHHDDEQEEPEVFLQHTISPAFSARPPTSRYRRRREEPLPHGKAQHVFFGDLVTFEHAGDTALVHDRYPIRDADDLFHITGDHQQRHATVGELAHQP